ncbi:hypothetical protein RvY_00831-1 [Ramazzottius varieornatus]|uniref:Uncharacterized protein n=1 Tax=Ramazzottius varieornatus TaxID=947166 RepID=A0A1D1ULB9_RAMVA|nr:hypothetical protein RvY_00831-1 [Ramazzottius varieornatus]
MMAALRWLATAPNNVYPHLRLLLKELEQGTIVGLKDDEVKMGPMLLKGGSLALYFHKLHKAQEPWDRLEAKMIKVVAEHNLAKADIELDILKPSAKKSAENAAANTTAGNPALAGVQEQVQMMTVPSSSHAVPAAQQHQQTRPADKTDPTPKRVAVRSPRENSAASVLVLCPPQRTRTTTRLRRSR